MAALHCGDCGILWPVDFAHYRQCPSCEGSTSYQVFAKPIDRVDAMSMRCHYMFDRYLQKKEAQARAEFEAIIAGIVIEVPEEAVSGD